MELSQCGAGGLLKARATMRVSDTSGHGGDGGSGARCWLWLLLFCSNRLLALSSLSSYCASTRAGDPVHRRGLGAGASRVGHISSVLRAFDYMVITTMHYRRLAFAVRFSDFTDCVSAAPPLEVYRVFPPEIDISDSVSVSRAQGEGPTPRVPSSPVGPTPRPRDALRPARESDE